MPNRAPKSWTAALANRAGLDAIRRGRNASLPNATPATIARAGGDPGRPAMPVELVLPWPPTGNHYAKHTRAGRHYLTPAVYTFRTAVAFERQERRIGTLHGDLVLSIEAHPPDRRRRDLDNLFKCTLDALQLAGVVADDHQFTVLTIKRREVVKGGVLKCRIYGA